MLTLEPLSIPATSSSATRFTSLAAHGANLFAGTASGAVFLFTRLDLGHPPHPPTSTENARASAVFPLLPQKVPIGALAVCAMTDSLLMLAGGADDASGAIVVWDVAGNRTLGGHTRHSGAPVTALQFCARTGRLVSGDAEGRVVVAELLGRGGGGGGGGGGSSGSSGALGSLFRGAAASAGAALLSGLATVASAAAGAPPPPLTPLREPFISACLQPDAGARVVQIALWPYCAAAGGGGAMSTALCVSTSRRTIAGLLPPPATDPKTGQPAPITLRLRPIGNKKTREGGFGVAFDPLAGNAGGGLAIAARPGRRAWAVDCAATGVFLGDGGGEGAPLAAQLTPRMYPDAMPPVRLTSGGGGKQQPPPPSGKQHTLGKLYTAVLLHPLQCGGGGGGGAGAAAASAPPPTALCAVTLGISLTGNSIYCLEGPPSHALIAWHCDLGTIFDVCVAPLFDAPQGTTLPPHAPRPSAIFILHGGGESGARSISRLAQWPAARMAAAARAFSIATNAAPGRCLPLFVPPPPLPDAAGGDDEEEGQAAAAPLPSSGAAATAATPALDTIKKGSAKTAAAVALPMSPVSPASPAAGGADLDDLLAAFHGAATPVALPRLPPTPASAATSTACSTPAVGSGATPGPPRPPPLPRRYSLQ